MQLTTFFTAIALILGISQAAVAPAVIKRADLEARDDSTIAGRKSRLYTDL